MKRTVNRLLFLGLAFAALGLLLQAPKVALADDDDPPAQVARLNLSQGSVSFQPAGDEDWVTAVPNRPLTSGDSIWSDDNSRAELHVGSTVLRLNGRTSLTLLQLDDRVTQLRLSEGSLFVRVRHLDDDDAFEVDTPNLAFALLKPGEYRIDVDQDGDQTVTTVWQGQGQVTGGGYSYNVLAGQQARFSGRDALDYDLYRIPPRDAFDQWAFDRDAREDRFESANYVSREMTGYEDLDDYGHWSYAGSYGPVWMPSGVPAAWAPYRYGHWAWIAPWGWTWVDDQPWGFAPFHYGRWAVWNNRWVWVPGPVVVRPVYAPAMVVFVGGGGYRWGSAPPAVGWFPLAPGEVYVPGYRCSPKYVTNVNTTNTVVNVTRVTNVYNYYTTNNATNVTRVTYVNQTMPNAVTVVSHETFIHAQPVGRNVMQVTQKEIVAAPVTHVVAVQPVKASIVGSGSPTQAKPPAPVMNRPVFGRRVPPQPPAAISRKPVVVSEPATSRRPEVVSERPAQPVPAVEKTPPARPVARPEALPAPEKKEWHPAETTPPHPLVKPVPNVREKTPAQNEQEEAKFRKWQEQHTKAAGPEKENKPPEPHPSDKKNPPQDRGAQDRTPKPAVRN